MSGENNILLMLPFMTVAFHAGLFMHGVNQTN